MPQSPYTPPTARISDPPEALQPAPASVRRAIVCLWVSVALAVAGTGLQLSSATQAVDIVVAVVTIAFTVGLFALIATKIRARRGWARWLYLALFVLGSVLFGASIVVTPEAFWSLPRLHQVSALVQFGLQTAALIFMFTPAARRWFSESRAAREGGE